MALIKCPGCGRDISDRALSCPQCGYQMQEHLIENAQGENVEIQEEGGVEADVLDAAFAQDKCEIDAPMQSTSKYKNRKHILIATIAGIVLVSVIGAALGFGLLLSNLIVDDISISEWQVEEEFGFAGNIIANTYVGTVKSEQKKPFIAVIERTDVSGYKTQFVYMDEGEGKLMTVESPDADLNSNWKPVGYFNGVVVGESDILIQRSEGDYSDYSSMEVTYYTGTINFEMTNKKSGLLLFDIEEDEYGGRINSPVVVIDGKATLNYSCSVPYKSRSSKFEVVPKMFCECKNVMEKDFTIETAYSVEKNESYYIGQENLAFEGYGDGILIYTRELLEGGDPEDRNITEYDYAFVENGKCTIKTNDYIEDEDEALEPQYEFNYVGYIAWTPLKEETK